MSASNPDHPATCACSMCEYSKFLAEQVAVSETDLAAWNRARLDACRITGSTAEFQENAISPAALAHAQSLGDPLE
jgi:hypothetical protein